MSPERRWAAPLHARRALLGLGLSGSLAWDLGFLTLGAAVVVVGLALRRIDRAEGPR